MNINTKHLNQYYFTHLPIQQASAHDALAVTLDRLRITAARTKNSRVAEESSDDVHLLIGLEVGKATMVYDMRRLDELIAFPKVRKTCTVVDGVKLMDVERDFENSKLQAWYRKQLVSEVTGK